MRRHRHGRRIRSGTRGGGGALAVLTCPDATCTERPGATYTIHSSVSAEVAVPAAPTRVRKLPGLIPSARPIRYTGTVRLNDRQRDALMGALEEAGLPEVTETYSFGSRAEDDTSGGDIDILVVGEITDPYGVEKRIRAAFHRRLDERIDVIVLNASDPDEEKALFARTVHKERIA